jgi:hypothetical protein
MEIDFTNALVISQILYVKYNFNYAHSKSTAFHAPIFTEPVNAGKYTAYVHRKKCGKYSWKFIYLHK